MSNKRKEIVEALNKPMLTTDLYEELKLCINLNSVFEQNINCIDDWFYGVISSLFYQVNNKSLILCGKQGIGKTEFVRNLLPQKKWFSEASPDKANVYESFILDCSEWENKDISFVLSSEQFIIQENPVCANKRLANLVYTTNINIPVGRRGIALYIESIDWIRYNSIDKEKLWIEIYNKNFGTEILTQKEIDSYFDYKK